MRAAVQYRSHDLLAVRSRTRRIHRVGGPHLGTPANALHVFSGVGRSPLSNEGAGRSRIPASCWIVLDDGLQGTVSRCVAKPWLVLACLAGIALIVGTSLAYDVTTVPTWSTPYTPANLALSALLAGTGARSAVPADRPHPSAMARVALSSSWLQLLLSQVRSCSPCTRQASPRWRTTSSPPPLSRHAIPWPSSRTSRSDSPDSRRRLIAAPRATGPVDTRAAHHGERARSGRRVRHAPRLLQPAHDGGILGIAVRTSDPPHLIRATRLTHLFASVQTVR